MFFFFKGNSAACNYLKKKFVLSFPNPRALITCYFCSGDSILEPCDIHNTQPEKHTKNTPGSEIWHKLPKGSPKAWHWILQLGQVKNLLKLRGFDQDAPGEFQFSLGIN